MVCIYRWHNLFELSLHNTFTIVKSFATSMENIKKTVFISLSKDIYTNLALEDWLYRNFDFERNVLLMLWQNDPCVVIGRHQNPWVEVNVNELTNITVNGVKLARRNSGGGTVYQDNGNLNMTFFTSKNSYNRKYNLEIIQRAIFQGYSISVDINKRDDLLLKGFKISGTAAKLGRSCAYHHCTLLVDSNKDNLHQALKKQERGIETNATKSLRSHISNLCEEDRNVSVSDLSKLVGWEYLKTPSYSQQTAEDSPSPDNFQLVCPTEEKFPGITELRQNLENWTWIYGKTPKFTVSHSFLLSEKIDCLDGSIECLNVTLIVENGCITDIKLTMSSCLSFSQFDLENIDMLKGSKFSEDLFISLKIQLAALIQSKNKFFNESVRQIVVEKK